ncbi:hypothetical protein IAU59_000989 [Kwoniella sp. CBS 9459]
MRRCPALGIFSLAAQEQGLLPQRERGISAPTTSDGSGAGAGVDASTIRRDRRDSDNLGGGRGNGEPSHSYPRYDTPRSSLERERAGNNAESLLLERLRMQEERYRKLEQRLNHFEADQRETLRAAAAAAAAAPARAVVNGNERNGSSTYGGSPLELLPGATPGGRDRGRQAIVADYSIIRSFKNSVSPYSMRACSAPSTRPLTTMLWLWVSRRNRKWARPFNSFLMYDAKAVELLFPSSKAMANIIYTVDTTNPPLIPVYILTMISLALIAPKRAAIITATVDPDSSIVDVEALQQCERKIHQLGGSPFLVLTQADEQFGKWPEVVNKGKPVEECPEDYHAEQLNTLGYAAPHINQSTTGGGGGGHFP